MLFKSAVLFFLALIAAPLWGPPLAVLLFALIN